MRRDNRVLLLEAVAREVARRADMPVPEVRVRKLRGRVTACVTILHGNRITVNEIAVNADNKMEPTVVLAHEMGHLKCMWFSRIEIVNMILFLFAMVSIVFRWIPVDLPLFFFLLFWFLKSMGREHIKTHVDRLPDGRLKVCCYKNG